MTLEHGRAWTRFTILAASIFIFTGPRLSAASTVTVPGTYGTIQQAMDGVADGGTIDVSAGTYPEALVLNNTTRSFTVRAVAGATVIVDAAGKGLPVVQILGATGHIVFQGMTFRNGTRSAGGGFIIQNSSPAFFNCIFENNTAYDGAGGALLNSNATFVGCTIRNNYAQHFGGGVYIIQGSHPVFTGCDIVTNHSGTGGAGVGNNGAGGGVFSNDSSPTFHTSRVNGNTSMFASGGIHHQGVYSSPNGRSMLVMDDTDVADNVSSQFPGAPNPSEGGGVHVEDNATATLTRVRILRNSAGTGGGLNAYRGQYDVLDSVIDSNHATVGFGGGVAATSNSASTSAPASVVNLTRTLVRLNTAASAGGGVAVVGDNSSSFKASMSLTSSVVDRNQAPGQGGGILLDRTNLTASNSLIINNHVTMNSAGLAFGGGLAIESTSSATITGTAISHNVSDQFGGGIFMDGGVTIDMSTSQIYDNTATSRGGGLFVGGAGGPQTGTLQTSTIADNNLGTTAAGQIQEDACSTVNYTNNVITPLSGSILFSGCLPGSRATGTTSTVPRFARFLAVGTGTSSTLAWSVGRATSVTISGIPTFTSPTNSPTGTADVTPASSTTYSLTATATTANGGNYTAVTAGVTVVQPPAPPPPPPTGHIVDGDFDGDGRADIAVYRPSSGTWYILKSGTGFSGGAGYVWGASTDVPVRGDFDGDGKADVAVYRPSSGHWFILKSSTNYTTSATYQWGTSGDIPVPGDYDGDGKTDIAIYRPSTGTWYILTSSSGFTAGAAYAWGASTDMPMPGDYDGDGKTDVAVYRPSSGHWFILKSSTKYTTSATYQWGTSGDIAVPGDYDGDGTTDLAIYRPSAGTWYTLTSSSGFTMGTGYAWGASTDVPVPGDYDGDGKTDVAVYRSSTANWFVLKSRTNYTSQITYQWGTTGDIPILKR